MRTLRIAAACSLLWSATTPGWAADPHPFDGLGAAPETLAVRRLSVVQRPDPLPSPRTNHGGAAVDGKLYIFGGFDGSRWTNDALVMDPGTGRWSPRAPMPANLTMVVAAPLGDGRVMVAGGPSLEGPSWRMVSPNSLGRMRPASTRLKDGRILVTGGFTGDVTSLSATEIYDPAREIWQAAAPMSLDRYTMAFTLLKDGRVLAAGGRRSLHNSTPTDTDLSEVYDPATDRWTRTRPMLWPLDNPLMFIRPDGKVLAIGGGFADGRHTETTQVFDPVRLTWSQGPPLNSPRVSGAAAVLKDGRFLVAGGYGNHSGALSSTEIYDPRTDRWTTAASMFEPRTDFTLTTLADGRVLAAGGTTGGSRSAEIYDPTRDEWVTVAGPHHGHSTGTSALIGGRVVLVGGADESGPNLESESFDPASGTWTPGPALALGRVQHGMALIDGDGLLVIGGSSGGYPLPAHVEAEVLFPDRRPTTDRFTFVYDTKGDRWSPGPPLTRTRIGGSLVQTPKGLYALGGGEASVDGLSDFEILQHGRWRIGGRLPFHLLNAASASLGGKVYVAGGTSAPRGRTTHPLNGAYALEAATDRWIALPSLPTARDGAAGAEFDGKLFVVGGEAGLHAQSLNAVEAFDPLKNEWETKSPLPRRVSHAVASTLDGRLYVVGGSPRDGDASAAVQVYDLRAESWSLYESPPAVVAAPPSERDRPSPLPNRMAMPAPVPRFAMKGPERPHDFALVVGVGEYKNLPAADYAENDAREMAGALGALGVPEENVVLLTGSKATLAEVSKYTEEWLPRRVSKDSRVYFYFSGHGAPDVKDGSAYLMPWDGDAAFVKSTGFPLTRLYAALGGLPVKRVVAMIDSCFSGAGGRSVLVAGARPLVTVKLPTAESPRISVLTASESEEVAGGYPERGHGLFSYYLLQGLGGAAAPEGADHLTLEQLYGYVHKHVIIDARRQNREQTPTLTSPDPKLRLY